MGTQSEHSSPSATLNSHLSGGSNNSSSGNNNNTNSNNIHNSITLNSGANSNNINNNIGAGSNNNNNIIHSNNTVSSGAGIAATVTATNAPNSHAPQIRSLEKTLEEAASTGVLRLNGRKLKEVSLKLLQKYDLSDTVVADLSKNRLNELPSFVWELYLLAELSLYSNLLRSLPSDGSLLTLQHLTYLNLSKNQISVIPQALCELPKLQVLIVSHNRLCSLPEELGHMACLSDLDVSCNEISFLPAQIGDLAALKYLDLRRNLLVELPIDLCELRGLTRLDISENRIQSLPSQMRHMEQLTEFVCDHNPLVTPPAALCTRGLIHVKKFLENEDRKRGGGPSESGTLTQASRRGVRSKDSLRLTGLRPPGPKNGAKDPSYTSDTSAVYNEKRFSGVGGCKDDVDAGDEIRRFAAQRMEFARSPKKPPPPPQQQPRVLQPYQQIPSYGSSTQPLMASFQPLPPPPPLPPAAATTSASSSSSTCGAAAGLYEMCAVSPSSDATTLQPAPGGHLTPTTLSPTSEFMPIQPDPTIVRPDEAVMGTSEPVPGSVGSGRCLTPEEEFRQRHEAIVAKQRVEALKRAQKEAVMAFVKQRQSPLPGGHSQSSLPHPQQPPPPPPPLQQQHQQPTGTFHHPGCSTVVATGGSPQLPLQQAATSPTSESPPPVPNFTMRRGLDRAREEQELLGRMRAIVEGRLKVSLPDNLAGALTDGVVLCHLANNVRPRSVATIHVPSATNPKLTMAKCRRNVDNFLDACRRLGVPTEEICESGDVLAEFDARALLTTIEAMLRVCRQSSTTSSGGGTKPTAKPPPPPPPVRSTSDPSYGSATANANGAQQQVQQQSQHLQPQHQQQSQPLHPQTVANNSAQKPAVESVRKDTVPGAITQLAGCVENTQQPGEQQSNEAVRAVGNVVGGLSVGVRSEAVSRNDSPVSTSEDISNLENLEYDALEVRLSSSKATPAQHTSTEDNAATALSGGEACRDDPRHTSAHEDDECDRESNTTFRSVPADAVRSQQPLRDGQILAAADDVGRQADLEKVETKGIGHDEGIVQTGALSAADNAEGGDVSSSVRKLRNLFEKSVDDTAERLRTAGTSTAAVVTAAALKPAVTAVADTTLNQKEGILLENSADVGVRVSTTEGNENGLNHHDDADDPSIFVQQCVTQQNGSSADANRVRSRGRLCNEVVEETAGKTGSLASGSKDVGLYTTNVKAGLVATGVSVVLYLYVYHPWILVLLVAVVSFVAYKYFTAAPAGSRNVREERNLDVSAKGDASQRNEDSNPSNADAS